VIIRISRGQVRPDAEGDVVARLRAATEGRRRPEGLHALFIGRHLTSTGTELVAITVWRDAQAMIEMLGDGWESSRWLPGVDDELMTHSSVEHFETAVEDFDPITAFAPAMVLGRAQP
jgi:quinol monooxygenase YgiN